MNIIAVPYFSLFVIPFMFALLIFSWLPSSLLHVLEIIFHILHDRVLSFVLFADQYFHFPFIIGKLNIILVIVYYILLLLVMTASEKKQMILAFRYGLLLCIFIVFLAVRPYLSPYGTVTMLDIGQGDAFIIELPYRKGVYFVDIGAQVTFPDFEATDKTYRQIIKPYLYGQEISHIDGVFLSHEDLDHDGSLQYLLEDFPIKEIIVSEYYKLDEERLSVWTRKGNPIIKRVQHAEVIDRPDMKMYVLGPRKETDSANENSLVLYTELGGLSWLFTGDIGKDTEKELISHYKDVTLDVLKVAHHGSKHSTDKALVKKVKHVAWISAGRNNTYGHPTEEVLHNLREENLKIYRTDQDGAVQYKFKGEKGIFKSFNN